MDEFVNEVKSTSEVNEEGIARKDQKARRLRTFNEGDMAALRHKSLDDYMIVDGSWWGSSTLAIMNCILDTIVPGGRLELIVDADTNVYGGASLAIWDYPGDDVRERPGLPAILREIADALEEKGDDDG